jgi:PAT family beta-lactamase induction signal transducer AmpG
VGRSAPVAEAADTGSHPDGTEAPAPLAPALRLSASHYAWLALVCAGSGFPSGLFQKTARLHWVRLGVSTVDLGLLSLLALPWTLKFLWAPVVDRTGGRRTWIVGALATLALLAVAYALLVASLPLAPAPVAATAAVPQPPIPPSIPIPTIAAVLLGVLALASATQDIAVDGYAVETFPGRAVGNATGIRINAYRLAYLAAGGLLVAQAGTVGWSGVWLIAAALLGVLGLCALRLPSAPRPERRGEPLWKPFVELVARPGFALLAAFVFLFKLCDAALAPMADVFLAKPVAEGGAAFGDSQMALATTIGLLLTIVGGLLGGWLTSRWGVFRALWTLGGLLAVSNFAYAAAAWMGGPVAPWAAAVVEPLCGGLGTAPFVALLMRSCSRSFAGTQYAILTAIFGLGSVAAGAFSGFGVVSLGYAGYFAITFLVALPAFALLPWLRRWLADRGGDPESAAATPVD